MLHGTPNVDSSDVEARAKALYSGLPGVLTFTNTRILWTKDGHSKPTVNIAHSKLTSSFFDFVNYTDEIFVTLSLQACFPPKQA